VIANTQTIILVIEAGDLQARGQLLDADPGVARVPQADPHGLHFNVGKSLIGQ